MNLALPRREGKEGRDPFFFPLFLFFFSLSLSPRQIAAKRRAPPPLLFPFWVSRAPSDLPFIIYLPFPPFLSLLFVCFFSPQFSAKLVFQKIQDNQSSKRSSKFWNFSNFGYLFFNFQQVKFLGTQDFFYFCIFLGKKNPISCPWPLRGCCREINQRQAGN